MKIFFLKMVLLFSITNSLWATPGEPVVNATIILKTTMNLLYYNRDYLRLSEDFIAFNENDKVISKADFFKSFTTGNYLSLKLSSNDKNSYYRLFKIKSTVSAEIHSILQQMGQLDYKYFKMEGKKLPGFKFKDLNGKIYDAKTTKNKIVVIKCWYLSCQVCREEIPSLNALVNRYINRNDIVFVSLAFDQKNALTSFLSKASFEYAIVPNKEKYLIKTLGIGNYPTHLIINKRGVIYKVLDSADDLISALNKEASIE